MKFRREKIVMAAAKSTAKPVAVATPATAEKAVAKAVETPAAEVKAEKPAAEKKAPAKKAAAKKEAPAKKAAAKKETVKKETVKKEAVKKETAKKEAPAKKAAKKAELKSSIEIQTAEKNYSNDDLVKIAKDVWEYDLQQKASDLTSVELYVKLEEKRVYYVMNKDFTGSFGI